MKLSIERTGPEPGGTTIETFISHVRPRPDPDFETKSQTEFELTDGTFTILHNESRARSGTGPELGSGILTEPRVEPDGEISTISYNGGLRGKSKGDTKFDTTCNSKDKGVASEVSMSELVKIRDGASRIEAELAGEKGKADARKQKGDEL